MDALGESWRQTWADCGLPAPPDLLEQLLAAYAEPGRKYHNQQHLAECLSHFAASRQLASRPADVALAIWFHDAVYVPAAKDNEARSADWARAALRMAGASTDLAERVAALVLATRHAEPATDSDVQLLIDIDLAILGAPRQRFDEYEAGVRAEYAVIPEPAYRAGRREVLQQFLARPAIYATKHFHQQLEALARENLQRSIEALR